MISGFMGQLLKNLVKKVQENNEADPKVKTADSSVFDNMMKKFDQKQTNTSSSVELPSSTDELCDDLCNEVEVIRQENEADPNVETADTSVFDQMKNELEALKKQLAEQQAANSGPAAPNVGSTIPSVEIPKVEIPAVETPAAASNELMAMTNSNGGSLSLRTAPDMGAGTMEIRVPDMTLIRVIEYSDKSIILDGQKSRFVLVDYNGQQGWVLESYLNFN